MIWHYINLSFRKLGKNFIFSSINISGLVIALACSFLIFLYVLNELSTDKFHKKSDNIYRVLVNSVWGIEFGSSYILAETIPEIFPEIENASRMYSFNHFYGGQYIAKEENEVEATRFFVTDQNFFDIFSFELISGDKNNLITDINSIVLTKSAAQKHFPNENPVGKTLKFNDSRGLRTHIVTGVIKDFPSNSTIQANYLGHIELISDIIRRREWGISATCSYILLQPDANIKVLEGKLNEFGQKHHPEKKYTYQLQNIRDAYLKSGFLSYYHLPQGNIKMIITYATIGLLILIIVSINFIIISTAKSSERIIEIGVRKVMGANRGILFKQIITESVTFALLALPLAIILSEFSLPFFNSLIGKKIDLNYFDNWPYLIGILLITILIGIASGSYIAVYVSSFNPEQIFKKRFTKRQSKFNLRKALISSQIIIFVGLLIFSSVIILQLDFIKNKKLGFNTDNLIAVYPPHDHHLYSCKTFVAEIKKNPNIINAAEVSSGLFTTTAMPNTYAINGDSEITSEFEILSGDYEYISTLEFDLIEGRGFDQRYGTDTAAIIINQTAAKLFQNNDAINQFLTSPTSSDEKYKVIGVVNDFHYGSVHSKIPPMGFILKRKKSNVTQIMVKINPKNPNETIQFLEETWNNYGPYGKFKYSFLENEISGQYHADKNFAETIKILALLTIIVACFGIFGFTFYNAKRKYKEIGIRKVYGASVSQILELMSKELAILLIVANIISWPIAYYISDNWLSKYAYQTSIPLWVFILAFIVSVTVVLLTSAITAFIAANKNPVDSLRYE